MKSIFSAAVALLLVLLISVFPERAGAQNWQLMDGAAQDIGVGADGTVWAIGTNPVPGGFGIYRRGPSGWINVPGGAVRIAVDPKGNAWVVNNTQTIFRFDGSQWIVVNGQARDVGIGANGTVWVIGNTPSPGGYAIFRTTDLGAHWTQIPGAAMRIAVDPQGNAWVINNTQNIFRFDGSKFVQTPGAAVDIGAGADGAVWVTGADGGIYRWGTTNWVQKSGGATQISVGPAGIVWVVNAGGQIFSGRDTSPSAATTVTTVPTTSGTPIVIQPGTTTSGSTSGNVTGGTLVSGSFGSQTPLVVTGLAPVFKPTNLLGGKYICPLIGNPGPYLALPCTDSSITSAYPGKVTGPATFLGKADGGGIACPSGFPDQGLYCGKPAAYGRGAGYAWQFGDAAFDSTGQWNRCKAANSQGCEQPGGGITLVYPLCQANYHAFGTNICSPDCPPGMTDIGVSCAKPPNCSSYGRVAGLGYAFGDPRNGGECWACPVLTHRSLFPVTNTDPMFPACTAGSDDGIVWQSAQYPEPGLAAFITHPDIVKLAFTDRGYVDAYLLKRAGGNVIQKEALWVQMISAPNDSAELKALIFAAIVTTAKQDLKLTTNAGTAVAFFQSYVQQRRTYVAQDALAMYNQYLNFNAYKMAKGTRQVMAAGGPMGFISAGTGAVITSPGASMSAMLGAPPDDYVNAAYSAAVPDSRGQAFLSAIGDLASLTYTPPAGKVVAGDPTAALSLGLSVATSAKAVHDLLAGLGVIQEIASLAGKVGAGLDMGASLGGSVLDAVAAVMTLVAQQQASTQYQTLVSTANTPVSVAQIMTTGSANDQNSLLMWWALGTSAYPASPAIRGQVLTSSSVCATYANQCATTQAIISAARL